MKLLVLGLPLFDGFLLICDSLGLFGDLLQQFLLKVFVALSHLDHDTFCFLLAVVDGLQGVLFPEALLLNRGSRGVSSLLFACEALLQTLHLGCQDDGHLSGIILVVTISVSFLSATLLFATHFNRC